MIKFGNQNENKANQDPRYTLSNIKNECIQMILDSGRSEESDFFDIMEDINKLNFKDHTIPTIKLELVSAIDRMIDLADFAFKTEKLFNYLLELQ